MYVIHQFTKRDKGHKNKKDQREKDEEMEKLWWVKDIKELVHLNTFGPYCQSNCYAD